MSLTVRDSLYYEVDLWNTGNNSQAKKVLVVTGTGKDLSTYSAGLHTLLNERFTIFVYLKERLVKIDCTTLPGHLNSSSLQVYTHEEIGKAITKNGFREDRVAILDPPFCSQLFQP